MSEPLYRKLSYLHAKRVEEFLLNHGRKEGDEWVYEPGWDDEEAARMLVRSSQDLAYVTASHVANLRRAALGRLRKVSKTPPDLSELLNQFRLLSETVDQLKEKTPVQGTRYISDLGTRVAKLEARFKRLADGLGEHYDD